MKYIIGIILGLVLGGVGVVYAKNSGMYEVNVYSERYQDGDIHKIYDSDNEVVCYVFKYGYAGGISCVK